MQLNTYIDHTILKPTTLLSDIERVCNEARQYQFASACVPPPFVKQTKALLEGSTVKTCTVIGFPFGYSTITSKKAEVYQAIEDGADELDIVINLIALKNNDWVYLQKEIEALAPIIKEKNKVIKIIIESGVLTDEEIIKCCELYGASGIDYLKTSTGYAEKGASIHAVTLFKQHLPAQVGIKASGGIRDYKFAKELIEAGATRLGCSASVAIVEGGKGQGSY